MAPVASIVAAIIRSTWRDLRGLGSFTGNNLLGVIVLLMAEEPLDRPSSTAFFFFLMGLLYLFPLARDLSERIPSDRFRLWPLTRAQLGIVYAVNLALNPLLAMAMLFAALSRDRIVGVGLFAAGAIAPLAVLAGHTIFRRGPAWGGGMLRLVPRLPGRLGGLILNHLREFLCLLDVYFAATLSFGGLLYSWLAAHPDPSARLVLGQLTVILLSTLAQTWFTFEVDAGRMRTRLLPLSGAGVLFAKDIAWGGLLLVIAWPYPILPTVAAAGIALAVGHYASIHDRFAQRRWRFAQGRLAPTGIIQMVGLVSAGAAAGQFGWRVAPVCLAIYFASLWWFGREWDNQFNTL